MSNLLRKYGGGASRFLAHDGALLHYRDEGEGEPVLMLHGAFSSLHTFEGWVELMKPVYRLLRFDLPGFGLSGTTPGKSYGIHGFVDVIDEFLDRMEIETVHLVGNSLGGWLCWEYTLRRPERVRSQVLIDSAGFLDGQSIPLPFQMARMPVVGRMMRFAVQRNMVEFFLKEVYGDPAKISTELMDRYFELFTREGNPEAFIRLVNTKYKDNTQQLKQISRPTLILWGKKDNWLPIENAYKFHRRIPGAEMVLYEHLGHIPMEEDPELTAEDVMEFWEKIGNRVGV